MSGSWSNDELLAAYDAAIALVGWDPRRSVPIGCSVANAVAKAPSAIAATGEVNGFIAIPRHLYKGSTNEEVACFARRIREALGLDEPAWKRLEWATTIFGEDPDDEAFVVAKLTDGIEFVIEEGGGPDARIGRINLVADAGDYFLLHETAAGTLDACKAALHDALISFHLRGLRAAMGAT